MSKDDQSSTPAGSREKLLALLRGCKDAPDDDAVRLVLSDWLEEHGDEDDLARAELIRLQVAPNTDLARVRELTQTHRAKWLGPFDREGFTCWWDRGLLRVSCSGGQSTRDVLKRAMESEVFDWVGHLAFHSVTRKDLRALASMPRLCELGSLELFCMRGDSGIELIVNSESFGRLSILRLCGKRFGIEGEEDANDPSPTTLELTDESLRMLASCSHLDRLTCLVVGEGRITAEGLLALGSSTCLRSLVQLAFSSRGLDPSSWEGLVDAPALANLERLGLNNIPLGPEGMAVLARAQHFGRVEVLSLNGSVVGNRGLSILTESSTFPNLNTLDLAACGLVDDGLYELARSNMLKGLKWLDIGDNEAITIDGFRAIVESPHIANMERLRFANIRLGEASAEALASTPYLGRLREIYFSRNALTEAGVIALTRSPYLQGFEHLHLESYKIGGEVARALAGWPALAECTSLRLSASIISIEDEGALALADSPYLAKLRWLTLDSPFIHDEGALALMNSPNLPRLERLVLSRARLSSRVALELEERFGEA